MTSYKCYKCNKVFNYKYDYNRHLNRKTSCKKDVPYRCNKCDKVCESKSDLTIHFNDEHVKRSIKQSISDEDTDISNQLSLDAAEDKNSILCKYCKREFSHKTHMYRHIRKFCKVKKEQDQIEANRDKILEDMKKEMMDMKRQLNNVVNKSTQNITNNNNNNNNNNYNNNINVKLVAFGQEDMDSMKPSEIFNIIKHGFSSVPELVKAIHFNKSRPENHNIYISNMRGSYVMTYDGDMWQLQDKNDTVNDMFDNGRDFLVTKYKDIKPKLNKRQENITKKFERFDNEIDHSEEKKDKIISDVKLLLYNKRDIPQNTHNLILNN